MVKVNGLPKTAKMEDGLMVPQAQARPQVSSFLLPAIATAMALPAFVVPTASIGQVHRMVSVHTTCSLTMGVPAWATTIAPSGSLSAVLRTDQDRKSTRLNSSHQIISYAVFCL